ncbi:hypothetical protein COOONC_18563 [Cooperia oncophora]
MEDKEIQLSPLFVSVFGKIFFAYWLITVPFYIMLVVFMIHAQVKKAPNLTSSFYTLCITTGIIDIVTLLNNYFGAVLPRWGWIASVYSSLGLPYAYVYLIIAWSTGTMQATSTSLLALNRLSAVLFPYRYDQMWSGLRLKLAVAIQIMPGFIASLHLLTTKVSLTPTGSRGVVVHITK